MVQSSQKMEEELPKWWQSKNKTEEDKEENTELG